MDGDRQPNDSPDFQKCEIENLPDSNDETIGGTEDTETLQQRLDAEISSGESRGSYFEFAQGEDLVEFEESADNASVSKTDKKDDNPTPAGPHFSMDDAQLLEKVKIFVDIALAERKAKKKLDSINPPPPPPI